MVAHNWTIVMCSIWGILEDYLEATLVQDAVAQAITEVSQLPMYSYASCIA